MKRIELKSIDHEEVIRFKIKGEKYYFKGFEANMVSNLKELPAETRISLMWLKEQECLDYFKIKRQSYREYALEILSKKWYDRETDHRFTLKHFECEFIEGHPTYQNVKYMVKKDQLSIETLSKIIDFFTKDFSELYTKK